MTVTAMERPVAATLDPAASASHRRTARIAGIWFVVTFISIAALPLYDSVLNDARFIVAGMSIEYLKKAEGVSVQRSDDGTSVLYREQVN